MIAKNISFCLFSYVKKKTQAMINKENYLAEGKKIPKCANKGCDNDVVVRDWKYYSFKHQCGNCTSRQQKNLSPPEGFAFVKKNIVKIKMVD